MANCSMPKNYASWILSFSSASIILLRSIMVSLKSGIIRYSLHVTYVFDVGSESCTFVITS